LQRAELALVSQLTTMNTQQKTLSSCFGEVREEVRKFFAYKFPHAAKVSYRKLNKGLSHSNFLVEVQENSQKSECAQYFAKNFESSIFSFEIFEQASKKFGEVDLGPKILDFSFNSVIMEFETGRHFELSELKQNWRKIAMLMADFHHHGQKISSDLSKSNELFSIKDHSPTFLGFAAEKLQNMANFNHDYFQERLGIKIDISTEVKLVLGDLEKTNVKKQELVLVHGDIHRENILVTQNDSKLMLIDFECCHLAHWTLDLANFFIECCGFEVNTQLYPDKNERSNFLKFYFDRRKACDQNFAPPSNSTLEKFLSVGLNFSNLYWSIWSAIIDLNSSSSSNQDFDYYRYAALRMKLYNEMKTNPVVYSSVNEFQE